MLQRLVRYIVALSLCLFIAVAGVFAQEVVTGIPSSLLQIGRLCEPYPAQVSDAGQHFIKSHEGFRSHPYHDVRGYAIGYGMHTWNGRKVTRHWPRFVSRAMADAQFLRQLPDYQAIVEADVCAPGLNPMPQHAYDSLVSIAYNLGRVNTDIVDHLSDGVPVTQEDFLATATVRGRISRVLKIRRLQEYFLFTGPD